MRTDVFAVLGALAALVLLAGPARAGEPGLELSRDGRTWSHRLSGPLLDEDARLVPGTAARADLWVRNSSGRTATMTVTTRSSSSSHLAPADDFRVRVGDTRLRGAQLSGCRVLTSGELAPGESTRVPVVVDLPAGSGDASERTSLTLGLRVRLVEGAATHACTPTAPPEVPGRVQTDGGPFASPVGGDLVVVAALGALSAWLVRRFRRSRERHDRDISAPGRGRSAPPAS